MKAQQYVFNVTGGQVKARIVGNGPRTLVMVHGIMVNGSVWEPMVEDLAETLRLVLLNLPLGGHSLPMQRDADGSLDAHAARVVQIVEQLGSPVTLVGSDTGGAIAQLAVVARPELFEALILFPSDAFDNCPPLLLKPLVALNKVPGLTAGVAGMLRHRILQATLMALVSRRSHSPTVLKRLLGDLPESAGVKRDLSKLIACLNPEPTRRTAALLNTFKKPVLILWARHDPLFPLDHAQRLGDLFDDAQVEIIDDSRAFISLDQPARAARAILDFTDRTFGGDL